MIFGLVEFGLAIIIKSFVYQYELLGFQVESLVQISLIIQSFSGKLNYSNLAGQPNSFS